VSPNKTLYIRDEDMPIWERAEQAAKQARQSLSQLVIGALQRYLPLEPPNGDLEQITVEVGEHRLKKRFIGRWLVDPDEHETRTDQQGFDAGAYWGVALTKRGRIAVYVAHVNEDWPTDLEVYDSLDDAANGKVPADILAMAATELGEERVVQLDI